MLSAFFSSVVEEPDIIIPPASSVSDLTFTLPPTSTSTLEEKFLIIIPSASPYSLSLELTVTSFITANLTEESSA